MTGGFTNYGGQKILNHTFGRQEWPVMANLYLSYAVTPSSDSSPGAEQTPAGDRIIVVNNLTNWPQAVNGVKTQGTDILFPKSQSNLGNVIDILFWDSQSPSSGNCFAWVQLPTSKLIETNDGILIPAGAITLTATASGLFSNYLKNAWLDHIFGAIPWTAPAAWSIGYVTDTPTDTTPGTEPAVGSYARLSVSNNTVYFPSAALGGVKTNGQLLEWQEASASQGSATYLVFFDAASGGNYCARNQITTTAIDLNTIPRLAANSLALYVD